VLLSVHSRSVFSNVQCVIAVVLCVIPLPSFSDKNTDSQGGFFVRKFKMDMHTYIHMRKYVNIFRMCVTSMMKKAEWKKSVLSFQQKVGRFVSLFALKSSQFHTSTGKFCVLQPLRAIFSCTTEISTVREKQSLDNDVYCRTRCSHLNAQ